jgi:phosphohistidine phosphatase
MKRELILIRHAKSSWEDASLDDFDRPLNKRGKRDGPKMAEYIVSIVPEIDLLLCSAAKRTRLTAQFFIEEWKLKDEQIMYLEDLYLASPRTIEQVIRSVDKKVERLALIGHNPGLTEVVNLIPHVHLDNLPTAGIYRASFKENWEKFRFKHLEHQAIVYPKMLKNE